MLRSSSGAKWLAEFALTPEPSRARTFREAVLHLSGYYYQNIYGVNYRVKEKNHDVGSGVSGPARDQDRSGRDPGAIVAQQRRAHLVGIATFLDPHTLRVTSSRGEQTYCADFFVIATGTKPADSAKVPINGRNIIDSDQVLEMPEIPKSMIVVGRRRDRRRVTLACSRPWACASFWWKNGRVCSNSRIPRWWRRCPTICAIIASPLRLNEEVESVEETPDGKVTANLESKKKLSGDALLFAVGRQGNVVELNLEAAGVQADARGRIKVGRYLPAPSNRTFTPSAT